MFDYSEGKLSIDFNAPFNAWKNFSLESAEKASISFAATALSTAFLWAKKVDDEKLHITDKAKQVDEQYKIVAKANDLEQKYAIGTRANQVKESAFDVASHVASYRVVAPIVPTVNAVVDHATEVAVALKEETLQKINPEVDADAEKVDDGNNEEEEDAEEDEE